MIRSASSQATTSSTARTTIELERVAAGRAQPRGVGGLAGPRAAAGRG